MSIVVPVVYNITQNQTSLAALQKELNNSALHAVQQHLSRWANTNMSVAGIRTSRGIYYEKYYGGKNPTLDIFF